MTSDDNLDLLAKELYGRPARAADYLGGSQAQIFKDAAEKLKELKAFARNIRDNWDCDADSHKHGTPCRACEAENVLSPR